MATLINLHRPKGFRDSSKFALNSDTGELIDWEWESLNPDDFSLDKEGNVFHNCNDKKSWSRLVRHGENANNFFEKSIKTHTPVSRQEKKNEGGKSFHGVHTSHRGKIRLRKKKYKNKKYKNSRWRCIIVQDKKRKRENRKRKRKKERKKAVIFNEKTLGDGACGASIERCKLCLTSSEIDNIFNRPQESRCCDFCDKIFDGIRVDCKVCSYCLHLVYRKIFCEDCKINLGEWNVDWRMKLNIPREHHPERCRCQECFQIRWLRPCFDCGMTCHTAMNCPWGTKIAADDEMWEYWAMEDDEREAIIRDDYLFGWD